MQDAKDFALWFLQNLPSFFLSTPIIQVIGFMFLGFTVRLFKDIINL